MTIEFKSCADDAVAEVERAGEHAPCDAWGSGHRATFFKAPSSPGGRRAVKAEKRCSPSRRENVSENELNAPAWF